MWHLEVGNSDIHFIRFFSMSFFVGGTIGMLHNITKKKGFIEIALRKKKGGGEAF